MDEVERRLFMGIKVSPKLQAELDHCVSGTECYFKEDKPEYLQFLTLGEEKFIGRFLRDGFPFHLTHSPSNHADGLSARTVLLIHSSNSSG